MASLVLLTVVFTLLLSVSVYSVPEEIIIPPVHGGTRASTGEFQHMAAIGWTTNGKIAYLCGGTLISSKFVLTAAHCAVNGDGEAPDTVWLGGTDVSDDEDPTAQRIRIRAFKKHPQYRPSRKYFDIALIELESEARIDDATCPACLWLEKDVPQEEMEAIGFGATGFGSDLSPTLQKIKLSAIDRNSCMERLPISSRVLPNGYVDEQFCAGSDHMDTCEGDSGGPIQTERVDVNWRVIPLVVGLVSFGSPCTNGSLGVYTRIAPYREWIEQEIQQPVDYLTCTRSSSCVRSKIYFTGLQKTSNESIIARVGLLWDSSESNRFECGATLIDNRFALTSAFCAQEKRGHPKFIVVESTGEMVEIDRVIIHPKYKPGRRANDIALLKLSKYLEAEYKSILLGDEESRKSDDKWHYPAYSTRYATNQKLFRKDDYQHYTMIPLEIDLVDCSSQEHKQDNLTCRKNPIDLIPTVCNIDHGGPVYLTSSGDSIPNLYGVVSDLSEGCSGDLITIKVSPHVEWIQRIFSDHSDERLIFY